MRNLPVRNPRMHESCVMNHHRSLRALLTLTLSLLFTALTACEDKRPVPAAGSGTPAPVVAPLLEKKQIADWCPEHGVPESICTRCNDHLIAAFKAKGDWCKEHDLPDTQCLLCHPDLAAKFQAMAPGAPSAEKR